MAATSQGRATGPRPGDERCEVRDEKRSQAEHGNSRTVGRVAGGSSHKISDIWDPSREDQNI